MLMHRFYILLSYDKLFLSRSNISKESRSCHASCIVYINIVCFSIVLIDSELPTIGENVFYTFNRKYAKLRVIIVF